MIKVITIENMIIQVSLELGFNNFYPMIFYYNFMSFLHFYHFRT
jgi:hypothetical protein